MKKVYILVSTSRPHWLGRQIAKWIVKNAKKQDDIKYQIVDLEDYNLPFIKRRFGRRNDDTIWNNKFSDADGFIFVTPEQQGEISPILSKAIPYLKTQWSHKPVGFVSYGYLKGKKAVKKLHRTAADIEMVPVLNSIQISEPWQYMSEEGEFENAKEEKNLKTMLSQIQHWVMARG